MVKSPPANAGDTGSSPGLGRSHMPRSNYARVPLLSLLSRAHEPQLLSPHATTTKARAPRACAPQQENLSFLKFLFFLSSFVMRKTYLRSFKIVNHDVIIKYLVSSFWLNRINIISI